MQGFFPTIRRAKVFFAAAILAALAVSCEAPHIERGTAVMLVDSAIRTTDPDQATDAVSQRIAGLLHGALLRLKPDMRVGPELAESWRVEDYKTFRFRLRSGLRFHDGSPLSASDVVESIARFRKNSPNAVAFAKVKSVKATSPLEVTVETEIPQPFLLSDFTAIKIFKRDGGRIVGAGSFELTEEFEGEVRARRFASYFETPPADGIDKIIFRFIVDDTTRYQLLMRGDANVVISGLSFTKTDHLRKYGLEKLQIIDTPGISYNYLCYNLADPRLAKLEVRQAIAHAINIPEILKYRLGHYGEAATGIISKALPEYYEPNVTRYEYDPAKAERLLDQAGYRRPKPGAMRFTLVFKTTLDKTKADFARIFASDLRAVGIGIRIQTVEGGTFFADLKARNFQLFESRWVGVSNPSIYFRAFHSSQAASGLNRGNYANPRIDALIDKGMVEPNDSKRKAYFAEVQKIVAAELPYLSLWHFNNTFIGARDMANIIMYPSGSYTTLAHIRTPR